MQVDMQISLHLLVRRYRYTIFNNNIITFSKTIMGKVANHTLPDNFINLHFSNEMKQVKTRCGESQTRIFYLTNSSLCLKFFLFTTIILVRFSFSHYCLFKTQDMQIEQLYIIIWNIFYWLSKLTSLVNSNGMMRILTRNNGSIYRYHHCKWYFSANTNWNMKEVTIFSRIISLNSNIPTNGQSTEH